MAYFTTAFLAGVLLTLGFKDFYPDLEKRFRERWKRPLEPADTRNPIDDAQSLQSVRTPSIGDGIESTIGNTPLIRIRSLSEATGCTILGKAEVRTLDASAGKTVAVVRSLKVDSFSMEQVEVLRIELL